jgi:hypothetical protein
MARRIIAATSVLLGLFTVVLWFLLVFRIYRWYNLIPNCPWFLVMLGIVLINLAGLAYLILDRRNHPQWLVTAGIAGNGLSLCAIGFFGLGSLFLEYVFRM